MTNLILPFASLCLSCWLPVVTWSLWLFCQPSD
jgi:hypothetical protein